MARTTTLSAVSTPDLPAPPAAPSPAPIEPQLAAGWFPDPNGRHEHRYFNGRSWTADVADGGQRSVDPMGTLPTPRPAFPPGPAGSTGNGIATAALVCGLIAVVLAWMPFVVVAGLVLAVLALVFGVQGLRRSNVTSAGRGKSIAGIVLGAVGVGLAVLGTILTVVVFREVRAFLDAAPHESEVVDCSVADGVARVSGTLTNRSDDPAEFSIFVTVRTAERTTEAGEAREIGTLDPEATTEWQVTTLVERSAESCTANVDVFGPLPFGVPMERP